MGSSCAGGMAVKNIEWWKNQYKKPCCMYEWFVSPARLRWFHRIFLSCTAENTKMTITHQDLSSSSSYHHIHFRALFSSIEGWAFRQVFLEGVLSTQNDFEGQQNPYLASFCHSQALHPMISLACQIFSVQPHSACVLLQSSLCCALHVQIISSYWCGAPNLSPGCQALWEGSLS